MRAVIQRAAGASVTVDGQIVGGFEGPGIVALVGVTHTDSAATATRLAEKIWTMRLFDSSHAPKDKGLEPDSPREVSAQDFDLPVLVISQFTLYADTRKGRRPTWEAAAPRSIAEPLVDDVVASLRDRGARVETGRFGADMKLALVNDGPITIIIDVD